MLVWSVWCYPDTCLELLKVIWSWAVFPDAEAKHKDGVGGSAGKSIAHCTHLSLIAFSSWSVADSATDSALWEPFDSEMDCDVASWCIKEGVSEGAVNRLLNIRNVSRCVVLPHSSRTHKHI